MPASRRYALVAVSLCAGCLGGAGGGVDSGNSLPDGFSTPFFEATVGDVGELGACTGDRDCAPGLDCLAIGWYPDLRECLRPCGPAAACGIDEVCYPASTSLPPALEPMANHCWQSLCGAALGNGAVDATCALGAELGLTTGVAGSCLTLADQGIAGADGMPVPVGVCLTGGVVAAGSSCDLVTRRDRSLDCVAGDLCVATPGAELTTSGICATLCDPTKQSVTSGPCAAGAVCEDLSLVTVAPAASGLRTTVATFGVCDVGATFCDPLAGPRCPIGSACSLTTPVRPHGLCLGHAPGGRSEGSPCTRDASDLLSDCDVASGLFCAEPLPASASLSCSSSLLGITTVCAPLCDPALATPCAEPARHCEPAFLAPGSPSGTPPTCDVYSLAWGICL